MTGSIRQWLVPAFVLACLVLGGASAGGYLANALLQLMGVALLFAALRTGPQPEAASSERQLTWLAILMLGIVLLQFVPLPWGLWSSLPGRGALAAELVSAGIGQSAGSVSLIPHESLKSALWLLPAAGMAFAMIRLRHLVNKRNLALAIIAATILGVLLGALQLVSGPQSRFYPYDITNRGMAVGLFANANHMASLLLVSIPFEAALLSRALALRGQRRLPAIIAVAAAFAMTLAGIVTNGSLAGYGLLLPVLLASVLIVAGSRKVRMAAGLLLPAVLGGLAIVLSTEEGQNLLNQASAMSQGGRQAIFATSVEALKDHSPVGSGLGTFAELYPSYEDPFAVTNRYVNHAHNDYLELVLETGIAGLAVLLGFLAWWTTSARRVWSEVGASPFARAAVIASAALLVHSLVDYPLRTAGLSVIFAACCALIAAPRKALPNPERDAMLGGTDDE